MLHPTSRSRRAAALAAVVALGLGSAALAGCGSDDEPTATPATTTAPTASGPAEVADDGTTSIAGSALADQLNALPVAQLTDDERAGLIWMREEEKLARDVYQALGTTTSLPIFANIAAAEQTHLDAVGALLDRYGIDDPAAGKAAGEFTDPTFTKLYDDLVAQGRASLTDALTVGATIEELDISDLQARATDTPDIALVYANLEKGSRNHLRAFATQLERRGVTYTPIYLSQGAYDAIVSTDIEQGRAG